MITTIERFTFGERYFKTLQLPSFSGGSFARLVAYEIAGVGTYEYEQVSNSVLPTAGLDRTVTNGEGDGNDVAAIVTITSNQRGIEKSTLFDYLKTCDYFDVEYCYSIDGGMALVTDIYRFVRLKEQSIEPDPFVDDGSEEPEHLPRAIHWRLPFRSLNDVACHVDIYDEGYVGAIWELTGTDQPFNYEESNGTGWLEFVRYKTGYINIVFEQFYSYRSEILPTTLTSRYVKAYYGEHLVFTGYIQPTELDNSFCEVPYTISLPVISPLGLLDKFSITTPTTDMVTLGEILRDAVGKLRADYTHVINNEITNIGGVQNFWAVKAFSTLFAPYNDNFKHYDDPKNIRTSQPLSFFFEGICNWRAWSLHDTPTAIVFTQAGGSSSSLYKRPIATCETATATANPSVVRTYNSFFVNSTSDNTQSVVPPLNKLTLTDGAQSNDSLSPRLSVFGGWYYNSEIRRAALIYKGNDVEGVGDLSSAKGTLTGTFPVGLCLGDTIDDYGTQLSGDRWAYVAGSGSGSIIKKTFKSFRYCKSYFAIKCRLYCTFRIQESANESVVHASLRVQQAGHYLTLGQSGGRYFWQWVDYATSFPVQCGKSGNMEVVVAFTSSSANLETRLHKIPTYYKFADLDNGDLPFEPISVEIFVDNTEIMEHGVFAIIDSLEIKEWATQESELGYGDQSDHKSSYDIKTYDGYGDGEASLALNFHNFPEMVSNSFIGTNLAIRQYTRLISLSPYKYMFFVRYWRTMTGRITQWLGSDNLYVDDIRTQEQPGARWKVMAESFDLANDERTLLTFKIP